MRIALSLLVALVLVGGLDASGRRVRNSGGWQPVSGGSSGGGIPSAPVPYNGSAAECADALAEVNATRAQRGLKPYINDPLLAQGALACARVRAQSHNAGHCGGQHGDFAYLPPDAHATTGGCAAWTPDWGWGACCTYDNYTYCGAAWVMGSDGRRYMHLFCR